MPECKNLKIAEEFLVKHSWPMTLSDARFNLCYCGDCYTSDMKDTYEKGGELYVIPRGYTRFGVKVDDAFAEHHGMWDTWTNCYHGTSIISAKSIIEHRQLLLPGETTMKGAKIVMPAGHIVGEQFFFTTPTIKYAEHPAYASQYEFKSPSTKKYYNIRVVLQCKQKPGSYTVQAETVGLGRNRICPFIPNDKMEWKTAHRSSIWPYAILLQIQQHGSRFEALTRRGTTMSGQGPVKETSKWQEVYCPHCHSSQDWVDPEHNQGVVLTCKSKVCNTKFKPFKCPHCTEVMTFCSCRSRYANDRFFTCENSRCAKELMSRKCPHCRTGFNFCQIPNKNQAVTVICAYKTCKTKSYVFMCPHCNEMTGQKHEVGREEGVVITCSDKLCLKKCQLARCPKCLHVNVCENAYSKVGRCDIVTCAYASCGTKFKQPLKSRICKGH